MNEELKPCPFCGGTDIEVDLHVMMGKWEVWCNDCFSSGKACNQKDDAVRMWNTRASLPESSAQQANAPDITRPLWSTCIMYDKSCDVVFCESCKAYTASKA